MAQKKPDETDPQPTPQQAADAAAAGQAAATAAAEAPPGQERQAARTAIERENTQRGLDLTEEQIDTIANRIADVFERRGAFDQPAPPAAQEAPASTPETAGEPVEPQVPQKRTFAERFLGS